MAIALEGQDVGGDTIQEPTVMAHHHRRAREFRQRLFQRPQGIDVEIVGGLVEQKEVGARFQHFRQVDPVTFSARQLADQLLLVGATEIEGPHIGAGPHAPLAQRDLLLTARYFLPHRGIRRQRVAGLIHRAELDRFTQPQGSGIGGVLAGDHAHQGRLPGAVGTDDTDDAARR